jgi:hypothetical protein
MRERNKVVFFVLNFFRVLNSPLDGVNILADRFESCSLDEGKCKIFTFENRRN